MSLQMATNIIPSTFAGVGDSFFDADEELAISWQVNGNSPMLAYRIVIQAVDTESTQKYDTGKVTLGSPFYGVDYKGDVQRFSASPIPASTLSGAGITNGNTYKYIISQWWGSTDEQSVTNASSSVVNAYTPPTVSIDSYPSTITKRMYTFTGQYSQSESVQIEWLRWQVIRYTDALKTASATVMDTGNIYGTAQLQCVYDGFNTDVSYAIKLDIQNQAGQQCTTGWKDIAVSYPTEDNANVLSACVNKEKGGVVIDWSSARSSIGIADGSYSIEPAEDETHKILVLNKQSNVSWSTVNALPMNFSDPYTVVWRGNPEWRYGEALYTLQMGNSFMQVSIAVNGGVGTIALKRSGQTIASITTTGGTVYPNRTWLIILTADQLAAQYLEPTGGLYPATALYPSDALYPQKNTDNDIRYWTTPVSYTQSPITGIELHGEQICDYLWVEKRSLTQEEVQEILDNTDYYPQFKTANTFFLANFENEDLNAGNLTATGYSLYRENLTTGEYKHVIDVGIDTLRVVDISAKNRNTYAYTLYYADEDTYIATPITSNQVTPNVWSYVLSACLLQEDGVYHVEKQYLFSANVESGNVTNNNKPNITQTFTPYPMLQKSVSNYRSGTLKALAGVIDRTTNEYKDDAYLVDEINSLGTSNYVLFLKDRAGNFMQVGISNNISTKIQDSWYNQAAEVSIPWVEVADSTSKNVVLDWKNVVVERSV